MLNGHTTETIARFNYDKDRLQITKPTYTSAIETVC